MTPWYLKDLLAAFLHTTRLQQPRSVLLVHCNLGRSVAPQQAHSCCRSVASSSRMGLIRGLNMQLHEWHEDGVHGGVGLASLLRRMT